MVIGTYLQLDSRLAGSYLYAHILVAYMIICAIMVTRKNQAFLCVGSKILLSLLKFLMGNMEGLLLEDFYIFIENRNI